MNIETVSILGNPVAKMTMEQVLEWVEKRIIEESRPAHLVTANAEILYRAYKEPELAEILKKADLVTADGSGAVWASNKLNCPLPQRVTGIDLAQHLFTMAEEKGWGMYFLGAKPETVEKAVLNTLSKHSKLKVRGYNHGYFSQQETPQVVANINSVRSQILLVALGAPKQEYFIRDNLKELGVPIVIGVGGSFDVLAGTAQRAPDWMQSLGLEWLYRLLKEPQRLGRMTALPKFVMEILRQKSRAKKAELKK